MSNLKNDNADTVKPKCACKTCRQGPELPKWAKSKVLATNCGTTCLENWDKWLERRKQVHKKLGSATNRAAHQLLMNSGDEYRQVQEERLRYEFAKYDSTFDKYRGNPQDFILPPSLKDPCNPREPSEYYFVKSRDQVKRPPQIDHVVVPDAINQEKDVFPRERNVFTTWQESAYRKERADFLAEKLHEIEPFKPQANELVLIGRRIGTRDDNSRELKPGKSSKSEIKTKFNSVQVMAADEHDVRSYDKRYDEENALSLRVNLSQGSIQTFFTQPKGLIINGQTFYATKFTGTKRIRMLFEKPSSTASVRAEMIITNPSITTLRLYFRKYEKFRLFGDCEHNPEQVFYFNKNELILIPGESKTISVWFKPAFSGSYAEYYEMYTKPPIYYGNNKLLLMLLGQAYDNFYGESTEIKNSLEERAAMRVARSTVERLIANLAEYYPETEVQNYVITEKEIFEAANQDLKLVDHHTLYSYDQKVVEDLKNLFEEMRLSHHPRTWNYSVKDLKTYARQKDLYTFFERKLALRERERFKLLSNELNTQLKTNEKVVGKSAKSSRARKKSLDTRKSVDKSLGKRVVIAEEVQDKEHKSYYFRVQELIRKLERPSLIPNKDRVKYLMAFLVLRGAFTKMSCEIQDLPYDFPPFPSIQNGNGTVPNNGTVPSTNFVDNNLPDRLIFERFDDFIVPKPKLFAVSTIDELPSFPKPAYLSKINREDTAKFLKAYIQGDESSKDDSQKKSITSKKKKDAPRKSVQIADGKAKVEDLIKPDFDPFAMIPEPPPETRKESRKDTVKSLKDKEKSSLAEPDPWTRNELYLIIRKNLSEGIMTMCEVLDTMPSEAAEPKVLHTLITNQVPEEQCKYHLLDGQSEGGSVDLPKEDLVLDSKTVLDDKLMVLAKEAEDAILALELQKSASKKSGMLKSKSQKFSRISTTLKKDDLEEEEEDPAKKLLDKLTSTLPMDVEENFEKDHRYISELMDLHWRKNEATKRLYIEGRTSFAQSPPGTAESSQLEKKVVDWDPPLFEPFREQKTPEEEKEFVEAAMQTSATERDISTLIYAGRSETSVSNIILQSELQAKEEPKEYKFYYLDNVEDVVDNNANNSGSG